MKNGSSKLFFCCCYWCGSPMGCLHGGEPFEDSLKGSRVCLPRHSSAAWRGFLHDPAFIFFSSWCLNYCRQGRIRGVFPKFNWFGCLLKHRTTQGTELSGFCNVSIWVDAVAVCGARFPAWPPGAGSFIWSTLRQGTVRRVGHTVRPGNQNHP